MKSGTVTVTVYPGPSPEQRYPPNDEWTEPEYTAWGAWISGSTGVVELDSQQKVVREHSIRHTTKQSDYYGRAIFTLHDDLEVNTDIYRRLNFIIALENSFAGRVTIQLIDAAGMIVRRDETIPLLEWTLKILPVGSVNAAFWEIDVFNTQPFDWTKVKQVDVTAHFPGTGTGKFWLDGIYFTYKIEGFRALDVTVVVKDTDPPVPVEGATVVYGHLVGVDPTTEKETYFWMDAEKKVTGSDGRVVFSELEPDWYGLRVSAKDFKDVLVKDIDLTATDKAITVELEPVSIWDMLLPVLMIGGFIVVTTVIVAKL